MFNEIFLIYCIGMGLLCNVSQEPSINTTITGTITNASTNITLNYTHKESSVCNGTMIEIQKGVCSEKERIYNDAQSKFEVDNYINPITSDFSEAVKAYEDYIADCSTIIHKCVNASWDEMGRTDRKIVLVER